MAPSEHLQWLDDNIRWFTALPARSMTVDVPNCPGWNVEQVLNHLAFGMGLAYPYALVADPDAVADQVWSEVPWPADISTHGDAMASFERHMGDCLSSFAATDPDLPCWTYSGPGTTRFWFRRAAIETTLHRMDVCEALKLDGPPLAEDRVVDAIAESIDFALPLAAAIVGGPYGAVSIRISGHEMALVLGPGSPTAEIAGLGDDVLAALWGRNHRAVSIAGDEQIARSWMAVIGEAFAGR